MSDGAGQAERVLDLLARLSAQPSAPFDRLLARIRRTAPAGTTVVVLTARDPGPFVPELRRLRRGGMDVAVVACGPDAGSEAQDIRGAGFVARSARLDGPWQTARRVVANA